ncbi:class I SAM-dependent methyltransferase [Nocardia sp. NPDC088792]|uniref:class I SAM-dependent methyltransferase n=1 Tax=Nocardia sp. NPDC088792 TaxID=3364332 RepID=UPI00382D5444
MGAHTHEHTHAQGNQGHHHGHTQDGIDWTTQIATLRRDDAMSAAAQAEIARRLIGLLDGAQPTVVDIGAGAGGQSAAFARELATRGGGRVVIVDAVPGLLEVARETTLAALAGDASVAVEIVHADAGSDELVSAVPEADLVWASRSVHHLPDQQAGTDRLARLLRTGGRLALAEGGLPTRCLPWDLGIGRPGLQDRLLARRDEAFVRMRADIADTVPMPYGWNTALSKAELTEVTSFSVLTDHPAPAIPAVRESVSSWLGFLRERGSDFLDEEDRTTLDTLLDESADTYVEKRDDIYMLGVTTVFLGKR